LLWSTIIETEETSAFGRLRLPFNVPCKAVRNPILVVADYDDFRLGMTTE